MRVDALLHEPALVQSLRSAFRQDARVRAMSPLFFPVSWKELLSRGEDRSFDVALVQPSFPVKEPVPPNGLRNLERLVAVLGPGTVIPFLGEADQTPSVLQALTPPRFPFLLLHGMDDHPVSVLRVLCRAEAFRLTQPLWEDLLHRREPEDIRLARAVLIGWPPPDSVAGAAKRQGIGSRQLRRRLTGARFPPPRRLLMWGKLWEALGLSRLGIQSRARISSILGLGDPSALAHLAKELTGKPLDEVLRPDEKDPFPPGFREVMTG